ncbi:MAG TPA: hypothetical protein VGA61_01090 [Anaerolineae bacterium]
MQAAPSKGAAPARQPMLTVAQVAGMDPASRAAYLATLSPSDQQAMQAQLLDYKRRANFRYMTETIDKVTRCTPVGGGTSASYSAGQTLIFNIPTASGAFAKELIFTLNLTATFAAGTGATYVLNAAGILAAIDNIRVEFNGAQAQLRPYILKYLYQLRGYCRAVPGQVIAGQTITTVQTDLGTTTPGVATGANTWNLVFRLPLNALHDLRPEGMLPAMGQGTTPQVKVTCAPAALGPDPVLNCAVENAGTGGSLSITGTVAVDVVYRDGTYLGGLDKLPLDLSGLGTAQYVTDQSLNNLAANITMRQRLTALLQHYYVLGVVIDGQQSAKFATKANITALEMDEDSVGQNKLQAWGLSAGGNISIDDYYERIRRHFGQDLDEGVIVWVAAPGFGQYDASNGEGRQVLDMTPGKWTDLNLGYQVGAVGAVANVSPRVEHYLVSLNPQGLIFG